jgi:hypothetical protein
MTVLAMRTMCCSNLVIHSSDVSSSCWLWQKMSIHRRTPGWSLNLASRATKNFKKLYFQAWLMKTVAAPTSYDDDAVVVAAAVACCLSSWQ